MADKYFLDTNVLVSGLLWNGNERRLIELASNGGIAAITSDYVLDEAAHVLKDYFKFDSEDVVNGLEQLGPAFSEIVEVSDKEILLLSKRLTDKKDVAILAAVVKSNAILVTGDKKLAAEARSLVRVTSAKELLE